MQRAYERGIKQISMIGMANIAYGKRHDKPQDKQKTKKGRRQTRKKANTQKGQTKGGVHKGQL